MVCEATAGAGKVKTKTAKKPREPVLKPAGRWALLNGREAFFASDGPDGLVHFDGCRCRECQKADRGKKVEPLPPLPTHSRACTCPICEAERFHNLLLMRLCADGRSPGTTEAIDTYAGQLEGWDAAGEWVESLGLGYSWEATVIVARRERVDVETVRAWTEPPNISSAEQDANDPNFAFEKDQLELHRMTGFTWSEIRNKPFRGDGTPADLAELVRQCDHALGCYADAILAATG